MNLPVNIRVASWLGIECLYVFMKDNNLSDVRLDKFAHQISALVYAQDVPAWDGESMNLEITGMGDPFPVELAAIDNLILLVEAIREISASQIYGAYKPEEVVYYLNQAINLSNLDLKNYDLSAMRRVSTESPAFGGPLSSDVVQSFTREIT